MGGSSSKVFERPARWPASGLVRSVALPSAPSQARRSTRGRTILSDVQQQHSVLVFVFGMVNAAAVLSRLDNSISSIGSGSSG